MNQIKDDGRIRYTRMLCVAAAVTLLSACARMDSAPPAKADIESASKAEVSMPEVVVIATRPRPDSRG